jgi:hypothetical protein
MRNVLRLAGVALLVLLIARHVYKRDAAAAVELVIFLAIVVAAIGPAVITAQQIRRGFDTDGGRDR